MHRKDLTAQILVRATEEQKEAWEGAAKRAGLTTSDWIRYTLSNASGPCAEYIQGTRLVTVGDTVLSGRTRDRVQLDSLSSTGALLYAVIRIMHRQSNPKSVYDFLLLVDELCHRAFFVSLADIYCPRSSDAVARGGGHNVRWPQEDRWRP